MRRYEQKVGHYSTPRASSHSLRKGVFVCIEMLINGCNRLQTDLRDFVFNESISPWSTRGRINLNSPAQVSLLRTNEKVECFDQTASNNPPLGEREANAINHKGASGFGRGHGQLQKALLIKSYSLRVESLKS